LFSDGSPTVWQSQLRNLKPQCHYFQCSDSTDVLEWTTALRVQMMLVS
jgi:hypothetical protein